MRVLFLDDMQERHAHAHHWFPDGAVIVPAHNAAECIGLYFLHQNGYDPFDLVSLDHDLGERWDGRSVVSALLVLHDRLELPKPLFAIHSWNIPCAEQMWWKLQQAGFEVVREPFAPEAYLALDP